MGHHCEYVDRIEIEYDYDQEDRYSFYSVVIETEEDHFEYDLTLYSESLCYYVINDEEGYNVDNGISFFSVDRFTVQYRLPDQTSIHLLPLQLRTSAEQAPMRDLLQLMLISQLTVES